MKYNLLVLSYIEQFEKHVKKSFKFLNNIITEPFYILSKKIFHYTDTHIVFILIKREIGELGVSSFLFRKFVD